MRHKKTLPMRRKFGGGDEYATYPLAGRASRFPGLEFYARVLFGPLRSLCWLAMRGKCDDRAWANSSAWFGDILEKVGCGIYVEGLGNIDAAKGPCVFVANHMSTLETFLLPAMIRPIRKVTFVVKKSLVAMPFFGPVMRSRNPVAVGRKNPREDLAVVLSEGKKRLDEGVSVIVFPQHTRSLYFDYNQFNSIGVKLARRAGVPVIPLALKTDAWGQGKKIKELGKIRPDLPARFKFAAPMGVEGNGRAEHERICGFISKTLADWQEKDGVNE